MFDVTVYQYSAWGAALGIPQPVVAWRRSFRRRWIARLYCWWTNLSVLRPKALSLRAEVRPKLRLVHPVKRRAA